MYKPEKFAQVLLIAVASCLILGCRTGGNQAVQSPFSAGNSYSQGSGTASAPAYTGGSGNRINSNPGYNSSGYNSGGSGSRSYSGGSGAR